MNLKSISDIEYNSSKKVTKKLAQNIITQNNNKSDSIKDVQNFIKKITATQNKI